MNKSLTGLLPVNNAGKTGLWAAHNSAGKLIIGLMLMSFFALTVRTQSQTTLTYPVSEITNTMKVYKYEHFISPTKKTFIQYIVVKAPNGEYKTVFNACDVCWEAYKGYSQKDTILRCNNCGNKFMINDVGAPGTGGCWPGYLPHTIEGENLVLTLPDIISGAHYFKVESYSGVNDENQDKSTPELTVMVRNDELNVKMSSAGQRTFSIYSLNGVLCRTMQSASGELDIDLGNLSSGVYYISVQESGRASGQFFSLWR